MDKTRLPKWFWAHWKKIKHKFPEPEGSWSTSSVKDALNAMGRFLDHGGTSPDAEWGDNLVGEPYRHHSTEEEIDAECEHLGEMLECVVTWDRVAWHSPDCIRITVHNPGYLA